MDEWIDEWMHGFRRTTHGQTIEGSRERNLWRNFGWKKKAAEWKNYWM